jgi:hypothetical protein
MCGTVGLGRLLAEGRDDLLPRLRRLAGDRRWRVREAVAMALQRLGDANLERLYAVAGTWAGGTPLERRAAAAAVCEPRLLSDEATGVRALALLEACLEADRGDPSLRVLRQALGYCFGIAAVAAPAEGKAALERLAASGAGDRRWIARDNLRKARLRRLDSEWTERLAETLP